MAVAERQRRLIRQHILHPDCLRHKRRLPLRLAAAHMVQMYRKALRPLVQLLRPQTGKLMQRTRRRGVQQRQQQPVTGAFCAGHRLRLHRHAAEGGQLPQALFAVLHGVHQNELLLGAGQRHVQDAHLLGLALPLQRQRQRRLGDGVVADMPRRVHPLRARAQLGVHQHGLVHILPAEHTVQIRQHHHRELQSLGSVYAHDAHAGGGGRRADLRGVPLFQQAAEVHDKIEQPRFAALHHPPGVIIQCAETGQTHLAVLHRAEHRRRMAAVIDVPQQLIRRHLPGCRPQLLQQRQERHAVRRIIPAQRFVIIPVRLERPYLRQSVRRHAHQRRAQHGDQRHVLPGVVHHLQQRQQHRHLHGGEEVLALAAVAGDVLPLQRRAERGQPRAGRPHEDHDVLRRHRPQPAILPLNGKALVQQGADAPGHESGLRLGTVEPLLLRILHADQVELHVPLRRRVILRAEVQLLLIGVVHFAHFLG